MLLVWPNAYGCSFQLGLRVQFGVTSIEELGAMLTLLASAAFYGNFIV